MTTIRLYNSRTRQKEDFVPIDAQNVRMYVCGPTVYDRAHLGNARPVVVFDVLNRLLRHVYGAGHVTYVRNFTDVDDKINARAAESGRPIGDITAETTEWFLQDMGALGALEPDHMPRATAYIGQMITMIEALIAKGHAYEAEGHVLFRVRSYADYGALSGRSVDDMIAGARVEVAPYKEDPMDFVLWKPSSGDLPGWDSPWGPNNGRGRPGWHIECSAMSYELLGASFDIHGGGNDLQFPHHENEIAQSCCAHPDGQFARVWMHNEMLQVEGKKMSKSLGNFFTVRDLLDQGVPGEVIRFVFLSTHYRKPMDWTAEKAREATKHMHLFAKTLYLTAGKSLSVPSEIIDSVSNDLNTSKATKTLIEFAKKGEKEKLQAGLEFLGFDPNVLIRKFISVGLPAVEEGDANPNVQLLTGLTQGAFVGLAPSTQSKLLQLGDKINKLRTVAKHSKDYSSVDEMTALLKSAGVEVRVSKDGIELVPGADFVPAKLEGL